MRHAASLGAGVPGPAGAFGEAGIADLWSGITYNNREAIDASQATDGADCFMFRPDTLVRYGWLDTNFQARLLRGQRLLRAGRAGGGDCRVVHGAQFYHHGSITVRHDRETAHHVSYWFALNCAYFARKWGVANPAGSRAEVLASYCRNPFNDSARPVSWFPENKAASRGLGSTANTLPAAPTASASNSVK